MTKIEITNALYDAMIEVLKLGAAGVANEAMVKATTEAWQRAKVESDLEDRETKRAEKKTSRIEAHGVKGVKGWAWRKTFSSPEALMAWADHHDAEVHATRIPD